MGNVSVSREALQKIKTALVNFQASMDSSTEHMKAHAEEEVVAVRNSLKKQQSIVIALENKVAKLTGEIEQRQAQIINNNNKLNSLTNSIAAGKAQINAIDQRISLLQAREQQLISRGSANGDHSGNDNSSQINAMENQIRECNNQRRRLNEQIAAMQREQNDHNRQNNLLREKEVRIEAELSMAKGELNKAREKSEKMKSAGALAESKISDLLGVVQHFKQTATATSSASKLGVEKCIAAIEEYLQLRLSTETHESGFSCAPSESIVQSASDSREAHRCPYTSIDDMPDDVYYQARDYQAYSIERYNSIIRKGGTSNEIEAFRATINRHRLLEDSHFVRRATLADIGDLSNLPLDELPGHSYVFTGIMSASGSSQMATEVSGGTTVFEIFAPEGLPALDLTSVASFQEVMFDSPQCFIERVEPMGYNSTRIQISIR